jgi:hypothetical protein
MDERGFFYWSFGLASSQIDLSEMRLIDSRATICLSCGESLVKKDQIANTRIVHHQSPAIHCNITTAFRSFLKKSQSISGMPEKQAPLRKVIDILHS